jgi:hypothetical protein
LFQSLFASERFYLTLEPHFPYRNGRHNAALAREEYTNPFASETWHVALKRNSFFTCLTIPRYGWVMLPDSAGHEMTARGIVSLS